MTGPVPSLKSRLPTEGNNLESPDEIKETCDFILDGQTQVTDAYSAPDMSVNAVVLWNDPL